MSYLHYVLPATLTFLIALYAFFKDDNAAKGSVLNWAFVLVTGLLWPITLPFIVWKRLLLLFTPNDVEARVETRVKDTFTQIHIFEKQSHTI